MPNYVLTQGAEADLLAIARYTASAWGEAQRIRYLQQIETVASELARGEGIYRQRNDLYPGVRVRVAGHHYVFCLPQHSGPALILAILHERMDLIAKLNERLD